MDESLVTGLSLVHPQPRVHHCAHAADSACPVAESGLSNASSGRVAGPFGCDFHRVYPSVPPPYDGSLMVGQSPGVVAGSLCAGAAEPNWSCAAAEQDSADAALPEAGATPCRATTLPHTRQKEYAFALVGSHGNEVF